MRKDLAEQLRAAIKQSGISANQLAKHTGVKQWTISRFLRGHDMAISRASKIARYLQLDLS